MRVTRQKPSYLAENGLSGVQDGGPLIRSERLDGPEKLLPSAQSYVRQNDSPGLPRDMPKMKITLIHSLPTLFSFGALNYSIN